MFGASSASFSALFVSVVLILTIDIAKPKSYITFPTLVDCLDPHPPMNGFIEPYFHTRQGATLTFRCNEGFNPTAINSTCSREGEWIPPPDQHDCIEVTS